jgi:hypothetical protein
MTSVDIIVIAFNNLEILQVQYTFIKKNILNPFKYHVIDNSTDNNISIVIKDYCTLNNISYTKLTLSPSRDTGISLSNAMNFTAKKIKFNNDLLLFVDSDIIPIKKTNLEDNLQDNWFYGCKQINSNTGTMYLRSALFLCLNRPEITNALNFSPCPGGDVGGSNYDTIFKRINPNKVADLKSFKYYSLDESINNFKNNIFTMYNLNDNIQTYFNNNNLMETMDNWLHFINISDWNKKGSKMAKVIELTNLLLVNDI